MVGPAGDRPAVEGMSTSTATGREPEETEQMSSTVALLAALGCAVSYGLGSVLEQIGARREATATSIDPRLLLRLIRQLPYVAGLGVDLLGWVLSLAALQVLPLFLVQAAVASSIAVTAVVARWVLHARLDGRQVAAIVVVVVGLVLLALAAAPDQVQPVGATFRLALVLGVGAVAVVAGALARFGSGGALGLAAVSGLAFSGTAVAGRVLVVPTHPLDLLHEPVAWALVAYGGLGMLVFALALQRGPVTTTNAVLFAVETVVPTVVGVVVLGDRARSGRWGLMVLGVMAAVAGAIGLALAGKGAVPTAGAEGSAPVGPVRPGLGEGPRP